MLFDTLVHAGALQGITVKHLGEVSGLAAYSLSHATSSEKDTERSALKLRCSDAAFGLSCLHPFRSCLDRENVISTCANAFCSPHGSDCNYHNFMTKERGVLCCRLLQLLLQLYFQNLVMVRQCKKPIPQELQPSLYASD